MLSFVLVSRVTKFTQVAFSLRNFHLKTPVTGKMIVCIAIDVCTCSDDLQSEAPETAITDDKNFNFLLKSDPTTGECTTYLCRHL